MTISKSNSFKDIDELIDSLSDDILYNMNNNK